VSGASAGAALPHALFVSHGSPTLPFDDVPARGFLRGLGAPLAAVRAIVGVSAHTIGGGVVVGSAPRMHAVHDFGGFPDALYRLRYDPPGDAALASRVAARLSAAGVAPLSQAPIDGLDHGLWVPLSLMFPEARVPVVVVSLDVRLDAAHHLAVGRALYGLRSEGVLVLGSGSITHNLRDVRVRAIGAPVEPYAQAFTDWAVATVCAGDADALVGWPQAPHAARAHPSAEHFVPLLVAAGAGGTRGAGVLLHASFTFGVLGMHAFAFG